MSQKSVVQYFWFSEHFGFWILGLQMRLAGIRFVTECE
jgi:hypothetical protein